MIVLNKYHRQLVKIYTHQKDTACLKTHVSDKKVHAKDQISPTARKPCLSKGISSCASIDISYSKMFSIAYKGGGQPFIKAKLYTSHLFFKYILMKLWPQYSFIWCYCLLRDKVSWKKTLNSAYIYIGKNYICILKIIIYLYVDIAQLGHRYKYSTCINLPCYYECFYHSCCNYFYYHHRLYLYLF